MKKFTSAEMNAMKALHEDGRTYKNLSEIFETSYATIYRNINPSHRTYDRAYAMGYRAGKRVTANV